MKVKNLKLLSVLLVIALVCGLSFSLPTSVVANTTEIEDIYYVKSPGYENITSTGYVEGFIADGSFNNPFPTVQAAIKAANEAGFPSDKVLTVKIIHNENWNSYSGGLIGKQQTNPEFHSMASWYHIGTVGSGTYGTVYSHNFKLVVEPNNINETTYLAYTDLLGSNAFLLLSGPTEFKNLTLFCPSNQDSRFVVANGNSLTYENVKHMKTNVWYNSTAAKWEKNTEKTSDSFAIYRGTGSTFGTDGRITEFNLLGTQSITYNAYVLNSHTSAKKATISGNYVYNINNPNATVKFRYGSEKAEIEHTVKNLNFKIDAVSSMNHSSGTGTLTVSDGLQIINNTGTDIANPNVTTLTVTNNNIYNINNKTGLSDAIDFYVNQEGNIEVGKYKVKEGLTVVAKVGEETVEPIDGVLDLTTKGAGTYEIVLLEAEFFVRSPGYKVLEGTETLSYVPDGTKDRPFKNVKDAIEYTNKSSLTTGDKVTLNIMQLDTWKEYNGSVVGKSSTQPENYTTFYDNVYYNTPYHSMTSWTDTSTSATSKAVYDSANPTDEFSYNLVVKAATGTYTDNGKVYLAYNNRLGNNGAMLLTGNVEFQGITIVTMRESRVLYTGYNKVKFSENCGFGQVGVSYNESISSGKTFKGITAAPDHSVAVSNSGGSNLGLDVTFDNKYTGSFGFVYDTDVRTAAASFSENTNLTVNNNDTNMTLTWRTPNSASNTTSHKIVNIDVKAGKVKNVANKNKGTITAEAVQAISAYGATISNFDEVMTNLSIENYHHVNVIGEGVTVEFNRGADGEVIEGQYKVTATEVSSVICKDKATKNSVEIVEGILDLSNKASGEYIIATNNQPDEKSSTYDEFINYRGQDLQNTYHKLANNQPLNVIYFGGSVTVGRGSTNNYSNSWRALVGEWLTTNFPFADINNINEAIGETGTHLGAYRFGKDIIDQNPDLLFIEYSINDYYNGASAARAQAQFETIVRTVRKELPNCDIVAIYVTSYGNSVDASNNKLHTQAAAHDEICKAYNIPSIYVGGALMTMLKEDKGWTKQTAQNNNESAYTNDTIWKEYITDDVHPTDAGYAYYFGVIKEYLNNELFHNNKDVTESVAHTVPVLQSKSLLNGETSYILPDDDERITFDNISVGDCKGAEGVPTESYVRRLQFNTTNDGTAYVTVTFTGTELAMITSAAASGSKYYVQVDEGQQITKTITKDPNIIISGLNYGEHTVKIMRNPKEALHIYAFFVRTPEKAENNLDIRDLVYFDENSSDETKDYRDLDFNGVVNGTDMSLLKKILLNNK